MKKTAFQFHARNNELSCFLQRVVAVNALYAYGIVLFPYHRNEITQDICTEQFNLAQYRFVVLSRQRIEPVKDEHWNQFSCMSRGALFIDIGEDSDTELTESAMGVASDDEVEKIWVKIIGQFRRNLLRGAFIIPFRSDVSARYDQHHRYSEGARQAYNNGAIIKPIAGGCHYELRQDI